MGEDSTKDDAELSLVETEERLEIDGVKSMSEK